MDIKHTVSMGESLWGLSHRYLGNGTKYQRIVDHHNQKVDEATRTGQSNGLLRIDNANLIYIGQTIMVPQKENIPSPGDGNKIEAGTNATGISLKVEYNFETGKNPIQYKPMETKDYTITTQMTGKITIENLTHSGYQNNFEIVMSANKDELSANLTFNDKALAEVTKYVNPKFDLATGKVKLEASIAAHANIGPYEFRVEMDAPNHLTYTFKPQPISAIVEKGKRKYKYSADIAFKVDVTLHPTNKKGPKRIKETAPMQNPALIEEKQTITEKHKNNSTGPVTADGLLLASILLLIIVPAARMLQLAPALRMQRYSPASRMPYSHSIDPNGLPDA